MVDQNLCIGSSIILYSVRKNNVDIEINKRSIKYLGRRTTKRTRLVSKPNLLFAQKSFVRSTERATAATIVEVHVFVVSFCYSNGTRKRGLLLVIFLLWRSNEENKEQKSLIYTKKNVIY